MALYDHAAAARRKRQREAFEKFKENLKENPLEGDNIALSAAIHEMEETIESQKKEIKEYRNFFSTLSKFLPRQFTTSTLIR